MTTMQRWMVWAIVMIIHVVPVLSQPIGPSPPTEDAGQFSSQPTNAIAENSDSFAQSIQPPTDITPPYCPPSPTQTQMSYPDIRTRFLGLPRFGLEMFQDQAQHDLSPAPEGQATIPAPAPPEYILGPGDVLAVRCWRGPREHVNHTAIITADGSIYLPLLGQTLVAGQTLSEDREIITRGYQRMYSDSQVSVDLTQMRTIQAYVTGAVQSPGKHTLLGTATVLSALYAAGGPSEIGSLRHLRVLRSSPPNGILAVEEIDLYPYLLQGQPLAGGTLQTGDTVFVPVVAKEVGIDGEVRRPARYELTDAENLGDLITMCGGIQSTGDASTVHIWRNTPAGRHLLSVDLNQPADTVDDIELRSGDLVEVLAAPEATLGLVEIAGAVNRPGLYAYVTGQRTSDLIRKAGGLSNAAYTKQAKLLRRQPDLHYYTTYFSVEAALNGDRGEDLALQPYDKIIIGSQAEMEPVSQVVIQGPVARPGAYGWVAGMKLGELIRQAGGLEPEAYGLRAHILRRGPQNRQHLIPVALTKAISGEPDADVTLERGDTVQILTAQEVTTPSEVQISGYVNNPGIYQRYQDMHVSDLIIAAGGLVPGAADKVQCIRTTTTGNIETIELGLHNDMEQAAFSVVPDLIIQDNDHISVLGSGKFIARPPVAIVEGEVQQPGAYPLVKPDTTLWAVLSKAGGLLETANPRGIVVYRTQEQFFPTGKQREPIGELQQILAAFNRESQEQILQRSTRATMVQGQINRALANIFSSEGGATVVVPPRLLSEQVWAEAIPVAGEHLVASRGTEEDIQLMDGDYILVPRRINMVGVVGAVVRSGAIPYEGPHSPRRYVQLSGGPAEDANLERMVVIRANTRVVPGKLAKEVYPGDVVVVPSDFLIRTVRAGSGYERILHSLVGLATAFLIF